MNNQKQVIVSPRQLELYEILTVSSVAPSFAEVNYMITDEAGKMIRKGAISNGSNEFKLCIVGFKTGNYQLSIGQMTAQFTVL